MAKDYNIYSRKQRWKLLLFVLALCIVGVSLAYTKTLVDKIASEERTKVEIWADAVQKRSALVNYTSNLFKKLQSGERKKVDLYIEATKYLARPDVTEVSFALNVLNENTTVPVILTNEKGDITSHRNINVEPEQAGRYFNKIQSFCFTEQTLQPGEEIRMPVLYFIDPRALEDENMQGVEQITLSYTFHESTTSRNPTDNDS